MKEEFKKFVRTKPELIKYVRDGTSSWQKFYELFDLYGDDENIWNKYILDKTTDNSFSKISDIVKNVDVDSIKSHINTAQKAIDFVSDLTKKTPVENVIKGPLNPRPINHFFED